jgi:uncharacterized delta-60 repeat protein
VFSRFATLRAPFVVAAIFAATAVPAAPGEWDQGYGTNGRVELVPGSSTFHSITQFIPQSDGKLVFAGLIYDGTFPLAPHNLFVARVTAEGVFDNTFGTGGIRRLDPGSGDETSNVSIVQQADGKLLVALEVPTGNPVTSSRVAVMRLNSDGSTDTTYGTNGLADAHPTGDTRSSTNPQIVLNPDGTSVVAFTIGAPGGSDLFLRRLTAAGSVDTTFGTAGLTTLDQGTDDLWAGSMVRQPNGSFAIGCYTYPQGSTKPKPCVIRVTPNGARDMSFDTDGFLPITFEQGPWRITHVRADADNRIVMLGVHEDTGGSFIARLTADGVPDVTFGSQGRIIPGSRTYVSAIELEPDGRIVAGGTRTELITPLSWIARYKSDGAPDPSFGVQGWIAADLALPGESISGSIGIASRIRYLVRQSDGAWITLTSAAATPPNERSLLVKYRALGSSPGALGLTTTSPVGIAPPLLRESTGVPLRLLAYRSGGVLGQVSVSYRVVSGTAIAGQDVEAATGTLTWNDGETSVKPFEVNLIDDAIADPNERFTVELFNVAGGATISNDHIEAQIIEDNGEDPASNVTVDTGTEVLEGHSAQITLTRKGNLRGTATVNYTTTAVSATAGADFPAASGTVTWGPNEGGMKSIVVATTQDADGENQESFEVRFTAGTPGVVLADNKTTLQIIDDDNVLFPGAHPDSWIITVPESATSVAIPMNRIGDPSQPLSVTYNTTVNPPTATAGTEFDPVSGSIDWLAGETGIKTINIALTPDTIPEPDERFVVNFGSGGGGLVIVYIIDDDIPVAPATVSFVSASATVAEDAGNVPIQVSLSSPMRETVAISTKFVTETANGADADTFDKAVTWQPGESGTKTINIPITNDARDEADESFSLALQLPGLVDAGSNSTTRVTITDDDPTPAGAPAPVLPQIVVAQAAVSIGENERTVTLQVQRVGDATGDASASWVASVGTASSPGDFVAQSGVLQWNGDETGTKTIDIALNGDTDDEPDETFNVMVTPSQGSALASTTTTVTLLDDDDVSVPPARLGFTQGAVTVGEAQTSVSVQVARTGNPNSAVTVNYATAAGTAGTADFTAATGTLMWAANDTAAKTITVTLLPDTIDEPDETFSIVLSAPSAGAEIDTTGTAMVTITDDDAAPAPPGNGGGSSGGGGGGRMDPFLLLALGLFLLVSLRRWRV